MALSKFDKLLWQSLYKDINIGSILWNSLKSLFFECDTSSSLKAVAEKHNQKRLQILKYALQKGANPNVLNPKTGITPLMFAVFDNQPQVAELLIQNGADINVSCHDITPVEIAIRKQAHDCLSLLLQHNVRFDTLPCAPVLYALLCDNMPAVWRLKDAGQDVNAPSGEQKLTPLIHAALHDKDSRNIYNLLQLKANPNIPDILGNTPLFFAVDSLEKTELLLEAKADVNHVNNKGSTPLIYAAAQDNPRLVSELIQAGADVNHQDNEGNTALHMAQNVEIAKLLLKAGADKKLKNRLLDTPVWGAVSRGKADVVQYFLEKGCNVNAIDSFGNSMLFRAVLLENESVVSALIQNHANLDIKSYDGITPLILSVLKKHNRMTGTLLKAGANAHLADNKGNTPLIHALYTSNAPAVKMLLQYGANPNVYDSRGNPALIIAVANTPELLPLFIQKGVNVNMKNDKGYTALMTAAALQDNKTIMLLLDAGADKKVIAQNGETFYNMLQFNSKITCGSHFVTNKIKSLLHQNHR